ncbi:MULTISPECIES: MFS transporter [unclassified Acinetobacter]|uniref:MFS transporter n=1 Tax=unclassified Acinetobacter TaxID=196816 RepID=UPI00190AF5BC|nr:MULTISPECIES: MFS transporter [unclassified Acinetobacter]MBK0065026.1 MFS transporter [Acinetobacter sp. S55]MBK0065314.1 MFS transporter [Acinetobacter sp. S54]
MKINFPLLALAIGAFAIGTTEFSPMGLLPNIAHDLNISIPTAGMLITGYALGVMLGAPIMTLWFGHFSRRKALILLMTLFTIGNILAAIAPNYWSLMAARLITSLNHGAFFGIGSVVAASLVPVHKQASAVASMFMGLTIANIGGVPLATWLGQTIGWRMSFFAISALGLLTMWSLYQALPPSSPGQSTDIKAEVKVLSRIPVIMALMTTVLGASAMFTLYTYIAPSLNAFTQASPMFITLMLVLIGIGFSIGNHFGGKFADLSLNKTLIGFLSLLIFIMLAFPWLAQSHLGAAIALVIWGIATFGLIPPVQMRVMKIAHQAPGLASSINVGAFNLGNAVGAAVGGLVLSLHLGYAAVSFAGAGLAGLGLLLVLLQIRFSRSVPSKQQYCS